MAFCVENPICNSFTYAEDTHECLLVDPSNTTYDDAGVTADIWTDKSLLDEYDGKENGVFSHFLIANPNFSGYLGTEWSAWTTICENDKVNRTRTCHVNTTACAAISTKFCGVGKTLIVGEILGLA